MTTTVRIERRSKKAFTLIIDHGIDPITKKRKKETQTVQTDDEEVAKLARLKILTDLAKKTYKPSSKATVEEYIEYWFTTPAAKRLAPKTLQGYRKNADLRIIPWIGHIKIRELTRDDLNKFYGKIIEVGHLDNLKPPEIDPVTGKEIPRKRKEVGKDTIEQHHRFIRRVLNHAIFEDEILERNVAARIVLPEPIKEFNADEGLVKVFTSDEIIALENHIEKDQKAIPYKNIIKVDLRTGMRRGEILALEVDCVNFKNRTIFIKRSLSYTKEKGCFFKPTNGKKRRIIEVTDEVLDAIRDEFRRQAPHKLRLKNNYQKNNLIFCREDGVNLHPDTISTLFPKLCKKAGVSELNFHCLRHTHASHLLAIEDIAHVSKRLGHSDVSITYKTYFHLIPLEKRAALKDLEKRFKKVV